MSSEKNERESNPAPPTPQLAFLFLRPILRKQGRREGRAVREESWSRHVESDRDGC